jgi:spermidine synthase
MNADGFGSATNFHQHESVLLYRRRSEYQEIEVKHGVQTNTKALYLDGVLQLSKFGEASYHEMMAHVPLQNLRDPPQHVLVIGNGDGGVTLRVLQHPSVKSVSHVELDDAVVNTSQRFFPELAKAFDDPRVSLHFANAIDWVKEEVHKRPGQFDACIIDFTDDPLAQPFTPAFFATLKKLLKPEGVLMQNAQDGAREHFELFQQIRDQHRKGGFLSVHPVLLDTVDYGSPYVAFLSSPKQTHCAEPTKEAKLRELSLVTEWYSSSTHLAALRYFPWMLTRWPELAKHDEACMALRMDSDEKKEMSGASMLQKASDDQEFQVELLLAKKYAGAGTSRSLDETVWWKGEGNPHRRRGSFSGGGKR